MHPYGTDRPVIIIDNQQKGTNVQMLPVSKHLHVYNIAHNDWSLVHRILFTNNQVGTVLVPGNVILSTSKCSSSTSVHHQQSTTHSYYWYWYWYFIKDHATNVNENNAIKLIQCNDSNTWLRKRTRLHKRRKESYKVKRHQLTNECLKAL